MELAAYEAAYASQTKWVKGKEIGGLRFEIWQKVVKLKEKEMDSGLALIIMRQPN